MKLFLFYLQLSLPLVAWVLAGKYIHPVLLLVGLCGYLWYNLYLANRKLQRKDCDVGFFAHLNPFSKRSRGLYEKVYFEA